MCTWTPVQGPWMRDLVGQGRLWLVLLHSRGPTLHNRCHLRHEQRNGAQDTLALRDARFPPTPVASSPRPLFLFQSYPPLSSSLRFGIRFGLHFFSSQLALHTVTPFLLVIWELKMIASPSSWVNEDYLPVGNIKGPQQSKPNISAFSPLVLGGRKFEPGTRHDARVRRVRGGSGGEWEKRSAPTPALPLADTPYTYIT